jgi:hypothetical protein
MRKEINPNINSKIITRMELGTSYVNGDKYEDNGYE